MPVFVTFRGSLIEGTSSFEFAKVGACRAVKCYVNAHSSIYSRCHIMQYHRTPNTISATCIIRFCIQASFALSSFPPWVRHPIMLSMVLSSHHSSWFAIASRDKLIQSSGDIALISISTKSSLNFLRPAVFLIEPVATKELANAGIIWLFLWRFKRDQAVEVLVH